MSVFEQVRDDIKNRLGEILNRLVETAHREPWIKLPQEYDVDRLQAVTIAAMNLALGPAEGADQRCQRLIRTAAKHGQDRLEQGYPDSIQYQECFLLRRAILDHIYEKHDSSQEWVFEAMLRVDSALALATEASTRGYNRPAYDAQGRWPHVIEEIECRWNPPPEK